MIEKEGTVLVTKNSVRIVGFHFNGSEFGNITDDMVTWVTSRMKSNQLGVQSTAFGARMQARLGYRLIILANRLIQNGGG